MSTDNKRRDDRLPVMWLGTLTTEDDREFLCEVRDISHAGTLVSCDEEFPMGTDLLLSIDGLGEFAGRVRWLGSNQLGLMILAGPDLALKKFALSAGGERSFQPELKDDL